MKNDYIMDTVESLGENLGKLVFESETEITPITIDSLCDKDMIIIILKNLILKNKFNEAEDLLFDFGKNNKKENSIEIAKLFYNELSLKTDSELANNNFSRDEISKGLKDFICIINT